MLEKTDSYSGNIVFEAGESKHLDEDAIKKKIENLTSKSERLLDLYLSEDLTKEQYRQKKESYEKEIADLNNALIQNNKATHNSYDSEQIIADVKEYLSDLLYARKQDDIFYKTIIEKIVVYDRNHFDVYLNLLPHRWKAVLNSAMVPNDLCGSIKHTTYLYR